ncbi:hypothetical protein HK098_002943 [Nowakowskiella sp. JEL0407]|nr:hypothetical protein HK098_002943 [Nowakowskiella sp. JEL0407]
MEDIPQEKRITGDFRPKNTNRINLFLCGLYRDRTEDFLQQIVENVAFFAEELFLVLLVLDSDLTNLFMNFEINGEILPIFIALEMIFSILILITFRNIQLSSRREEKLMLSSTNRANIYRGSYLVFTVKMLLLLFGSAIALPIFQLNAKSISCGMVSNPSIYRFCSEFGGPPFYLSIVACIVGIPLQVLFCVISILTNPKCKPSFRYSPYTRSNSRIDLFYTTIRTVLSLAAIFLQPNRFTRLVVNIVAISVMFVLSLRLQPSFWPFYNNFRSCVFGGSLVVSIVTLALPGTMVFTVYITILILLSILGFVGGYTAAEATRTRLIRNFTIKVKHASRIRTQFTAIFGVGTAANPQTSTQIQLPSGMQVNAFDIWYDVELTARQLVLDARLRGMTEAEILEMKIVFDQGFREFPENSFLLIQYALYQSALHLASDEHLYFLLTKAEIRRPPIDADPILHSELLMIKHTAGDMTFEYEKCMNLATASHSRAHQQVIDCWKFILNNPERLKSLPDYAERLVASFNETTEIYKLLIKKWPHRKEGQKGYLTFLANVRKDSAGTAALEAQILNDEDERSSQRASQSSLATSVDLNSSKGRKSLFTRARRASISVGASISGAASPPQINTKVKKRKLGSKKAQDIRKDLDAQLRWNIDGFATSMKIGAVFTLLLMVVVIFLFWNLHQTVAADILGRKLLSFVRTELTRSVLGIRRLIDSSSSGITLLEDTRESVYNGFQEIVANASAISFASTRAIFKLSFSFGTEYSNLFRQDVIAISRNYPWIWDESAIERKMTLLRGLTLISENSAILSDLNFIDMNSLLRDVDIANRSTYSLASSSLINYSRFILDNGVEKIPRNVRRLNSTNPESDIESIFSALDQLRTNFFVLHAKDWADMNSWIYLLYLITLTELLYAFLFIKQGIESLMRQQQRALKIFLCLPKSLISNMIVSLEKSAPWYKDQQEMTSSGSLPNIDAELSMETDPETPPIQSGAANIQSGDQPTEVPNVDGQPKMTKPETEVDPVKRMLREKQRMYSLIYGLIITLFALFFVTVFYNTAVNNSIKRYEVISELNSKTTRLVLSAFECYWNDPNIFESLDDCLAHLKRGLEDIEPLRDVLADPTIVKNDRELAFLAQECYAKNKRLCENRKYLGESNPTYIASKNGLVFLFNNIILCIEDLVGVFRKNESSVELFRHLDDIGVHDLLDGLEAYEKTITLEDLNDTKNWIYQLFIGFWAVSVILGLVNFVVMHSSMNRIRMHFSSSWELLTLIPAQAHETLPQLTEYARKLSKKTQSERGFFSNLWGFLNGNVEGSLESYQQKDWSKRKNESNVKSDNAINLFRPQNKIPKSGLNLWLNFDFHRNMYPRELSTQEKTNAYMKRRRLSPTKIGAVHAWALAIAVVITGQQSGWNIGIKHAGFGGFMIATGVAFINYMFIAYALSDMHSKYSSAMSGVASYARNVGFYDSFIFIAGTFELIEYVSFIALIVNSLAQDVSTIAGTGSLMTILHIVAIVIGFILLVESIDHKLWHIVLYLSVVSVGIIVFYFIWGATDFAPAKLLISDGPPNFSNPDAWMRNGWVGTVMAIPPALWWFTGIECVPLVAPELQDQKAVRSGLFSSTITLFITAVPTALFLAGSGYGANYIGSDVIPSVEFTVYKLGEAYSSLGTVLLLPAKFVNLLALIVVAGRRIWSLSVSGLYPRWLSITCWETESEGRSPFRSYVAIMLCGLVINVAMFLQLQYFKSDVQLGQLILDITLCSAMSFYVCIGLVHMKMAIFVKGDPIYKFLGRILCGGTIFALNLFTLVIDLYFGVQSFKIGFISLLVIVTVMFTYFLFVAQFNMRVGDGF